MLYLPPSLAFPTTPLQRRPRTPRGSEARGPPTRSVAPDASPQPDPSFPWTAVSPGSHLLSRGSSCPSQALLSQPTAQSRPEAAHGKPPALVATVGPGQLLWWRSWSPGGEVTSAWPGKAGRRGQGQEATPSGASPAGPADTGAGGERSTWAVEITAPLPHPSPCQIVLNYNDRRWQASTPRRRTCQTLRGSAPTRPAPPRRPAF